MRMRNLALVLAVFCVVWGSPAQAQVSDAYCDQTYGGAGTDHSQEISPACDDGYVIAANTGMEVVGAGRGMLIKTDKHFNIEWTKVYEGGPSGETCGGVIPNYEGGVCTGYVLICATGYDGYVTGDEDAWLIKTDLSGNEQDSCTFGGPDIDRGSAIVQAPDGKYVFVGTRDYQYPNNSIGDIWLVKTHFDPAGPGCVVDWEKTYNGPSGGNWGVTLIRTNDGYAVLGADGTPGIPWKSWLIRTNEVGDVMCNTIFDDLDPKSGLVQTQPDGGFAFTAGLKNTTPDWDAVLVKTDGACNEQWRVVRDGGAEDDFYDMIQTSPDNGYLVAGMTGSYGAGGNDGWLVKFSSSGVEEWFQVFGGPENDSFNTVVARTSEVTGQDYLATGWTKSFGAGDQDVWFINYNPAYNCPDCDRDGFGNPARLAPLCADSRLDCDDGDPEVNPGHAEVCGNGIDDNCDGQSDPYPCPGNAVAETFGPRSLTGSGLANALGLVLIPVGAVILLRVMRRRK